MFFSVFGSDSATFFYVAIYLHFVNVAFIFLLDVLQLMMFNICVNCPVSDD